MSLIKSKKRVADHGEVLTPAWMVEAMLDLIKGETERIDSCFLEPSCGSGNFLVQVLRRKLAAVELKFGKSGFEKRHYGLLALMCTYGIDSTFRGKEKKSGNDLKVYRNGGIGYVARSEITKEQAVFDKWKVFIGRAAPGTGNKDTYPHRIISTPFIGEPGSISSWTYMYIGPFDSKTEAESALSYLSCRLTRLLILLHKPSQDTTRKVYTFVPIQEWTRRWTDEDLYTKYGISASEIAFIEKVVRPMDLSG